MSSDSSAVVAPLRPGRVLGRTQAQRRKEAETAILQAAVTIIASRGLDALTLAEAGEAAGYSRALPAHYFGSREDLIVAVAGRLAQSYRDDLLSGERLGGARGLEALMAAIGLYLEDAGRSATLQRALHEVLNAALNRPSIAPFVAKLDHDSADGFARQIRAAIRRGEIRSDIDPDAEGVLLLATLRGVVRQWLVAPDKIDLAAVRRALIAGLRRNWAPSAASG